MVANVRHAGARNVRSRAGRPMEFTSLLDKSMHLSRSNRRPHDPLSMKRPRMPPGTKKNCNVQDISHDTASCGNRAAFADSHAIGSHRGGCRHDWIKADAGE